MNRIILFACLGWTLLLASTAYPYWYPENFNKIHEQCRAEHPMTPTYEEQIRDGHFIDSEAIRDVFLCTLTNLRIYTTDKGFDGERLAYELNRKPPKQCILELVRECVDKNKEKQPEGAMLFNVMKCILELRIMLEDGAGGCDLKR